MQSDVNPRTLKELEDLQSDIKLHGDGPITRAKAKKMLGAFYSILRHVFSAAALPWISTQEKTKEDPGLVTLLVHEISG